MDNKDLDSMNLYQLFDAMEPIVAPPAISRSPEGPGWTVLLVLVITSLLMFFAIHYYWRYKNRHRYSAVAEVRALQDNFSPLDVSEILKRCALNDFPRHQIASLTEQPWSDFLNQHAEGRTQFQNFYQLNTQAENLDRNALKQQAIVWLENYRVSP